MRRNLLELGSLAACILSLVAVSATQAEVLDASQASTTAETPAGEQPAAADNAGGSASSAAEVSLTPAKSSASESLAIAPSDATSVEAAQLKRAEEIVKEVDEILARMKAAADAALPHEIAVGRRQLNALQEEAKTLERSEKLQGISRMPLVGLIIAYAYECSNFAAVTEMTTAYEREREALLAGWGGPDPETPRKWRSINGSVAEGVLVSYDRDYVLVRRTNGKLAKAPRATLSKEDNDFLDALPATTPAEASAADNPNPVESPDIQQTNPVAIRVQELERSRID